MSREVVIVSGVRTAIGTFGGSLKDIPPTELGALVVREALARARVEGKDVGHVVFGHVVNTEPKDMYLSRVAAINGGCADTTPAFNVNRLCGSGLQAIVSASQAILLGDCDIAIGAGAENMSRGPYANLTQRWGTRMGDAKLVDMMVGALHDPFHNIHMGVTAENVAAKYGITREMQDALAVESHNRAERATAAGYFKDQIVPVMLKSKKGDVAYATDEHFRAGAKLEDFAKLTPVVATENGTVTAGHAGGAQAHGSVGDRSGCDRGQRGLRRPGLRGHEGTGPGPGQGQPERVGHLAGPPDRRHWRADHGEGPARAAAHQRPLRAGDHVHRWRPGHCGHLRARLTHLPRAATVAP